MITRAKTWRQEKEESDALVEMLTKPKPQRSNSKTREVLREATKEQDTVSTVSSPIHWGIISLLLIGFLSSLGTFASIHVPGEIELTNAIANLSS